MDTSIGQVSGGSEKIFLLLVLIFSNFSGMYMIATGKKLRIEINDTLSK